MAVSCRTTSVTDVHRTYGMDHHDFRLEILNDLREYTNDVTPLDPDMVRLHCAAVQNAIRWHLDAMGKAPGTA